MIAHQLRIGNSQELNNFFDQLFKNYYMVHMRVLHQLNTSLNILFNILFNINF